MTKNIRNIPLGMKREVRQRCGFGCVICGLPLYEYEHMEGWANVMRHIAHEITLLCDSHHKERTNGLLPLEKVRESNLNPYNLRSGISSSYLLHYSGDSPSVGIAGNTFKSALLEAAGSFSPVIMDGTSPLSFRLEDGHVLFSFNANNGLGIPVIKIVDNELQYVVGSAWDFQFQGRILTVRNGPGDIFLELEFAVPSRLNIKRGGFFWNGVRINIDGNSMLVGSTGLSFTDCEFEGWNAAIILRRNL
jgi:hypothetical protein